MLARIALLAALVQPVPSPTAGAGPMARIFATVGHSEFCPAGNVTLDVTTGRYELTPRAPRRNCDEPTLERPARTGILDGERLHAVRSAYARVLSEGLEVAGCTQNPPREVIIVANGGVPILIVTTGQLAASAPDNRICWSVAANALHLAVDRAFEEQHGS